MCHVRSIARSKQYSQITARTNFDTVVTKLSACVTTKLPLWLLIMVLECAKLVLQEMMLHERYSHLLLVDLGIK